MLIICFDENYWERISRQRRLPQASCGRLDGVEHGKQQWGKTGLDLAMRNHNAMDVDKTYDTPLCPTQCHGLGPARGLRLARRITALTDRVNVVRCGRDTCDCSATKLR